MAEKHGMGSFDKMTLKLGEVIPEKEKPTNTWCMKITSMHGDADAYTDNKFFHPDLEVFRKYVAVIYDYHRIHSNNRRDHKILKEIINQSALKYGIDHLDNYGTAIDWFHNIVDNDCTCDYQYVCVIDAVDLSYFDSDGVEYRVDAVNDDDKPIDFARYW